MEESKRQIKPSSIVFLIIYIVIILILSYFTIINFYKIKDETKNEESIKNELVKVKSEYDSLMTTQQSLVSEITNLKKQIKKRKNKKTNDYRWIIRISVISFIISIVFSTSSELLIPNVPLFVGIILLIIFISIGILFDMIGMSVASANEKVFHSMNSRKVSC